MEKFMYGQSSVVEPIAAVLGLQLHFHLILPYALAFAGCHDLCGEEVIPETQQDNNTDIATMGFVGDLLL
jgi:ZIP family zinc transporter